MTNYIMALDQGTTSSRALLADETGQIQAIAQYPLNQIYPQPGWVEHDPNNILYTILQSMASVLEKSNVSPKEIAAIGITNQRETIVVWDKETGSPVANALVWQCRRTSELCKQLKFQGLEPMIREKTGLLLDPYFSATKLKWLLDQDISLKTRAKQGKILCGTVDSWLIWNLTGGKVHCTDYSNASRTMLFDIKKLCWDEELCQLFDIPMAMLPTPLPSSHPYGTLAAGLPGLTQLAGIPICGAAGDQQAALFGQGCFQPGLAKTTYGTGCFTLMNIGSQPIPSDHNLLTSIAWNLGGETTYCLEGSAFSGGSAVEWLRQGLGVIDNPKSTSDLAKSVDSTGGVYFVPAFTGLGAPYWNSEARATFFGITQGTGKAEICRAVLESIGYQVADLVSTMESDVGQAITQLRVDGGVCANDFLMEFQSDLCQVPVNRPRCTESTAMGAAYLAGLSVGLWKDTLQLEHMRAQANLFQPKMDDQTRATHLAKWHKAVDLACQW